MSTLATGPVERHAFGWPQGSIRAILALMVVLIVCTLMLIPPREGPIPIPPYLLYLMFLILGHYFAARGPARLGTDTRQRHPLGLPRGFVRLVLLAALVGTVVYRYTTGEASLAEQWHASLLLIASEPLLPLIILGGFFLGVVLRMLIGHFPPPWFQDIEAWVALIAMVLMGVAVIIHLVIKPSVNMDLNMLEWETFLGALVAFYFGERS